LVPKSVLVLNIQTVVAMLQRSLEAVEFPVYLAQSRTIDCVVMDGTRPAGCHTEVATDGVD
jgi:hypothetical protein